MKIPGTIKILHLEDAPDDAELVARELKKAGINFEIIHVESKGDFGNALNKFSPDIILSDHSLSSFDSHEALEMVKQKGIDAPFILVTATVSEEYAVSIIKDGASDYILKDRLQRLPNAILMAREKYVLAKERILADVALRDSEEKYRLLFESNPLPMWMISKFTLNIIAVNEAAINHYGYTREEFLELNAKDIRPAEDIDKFVAFVNAESAGIIKRGIWRHKKKDGTVIMVDIIAHNVVYGNIEARLVLANDVTERLEAEARLAEQRHIQQKLITQTGIQVQERVKEEIGKELHDNINQILAASKLYLEFAMKKDGLNSELLETCRNNLNLALEEIRKLSHTLIAPSLGDITLVEAIKILISEIRIVTPLQPQLNTENFDEEILSNDIKLMIYRIIQEQINNILKHSGAKNATIDLRISTDRILLSIQDDGHGFDTRKKAEGIGLRNIKQRASFYDGTVQITSAPGEGCKLEIRISIPV